MTPRTPLSRLFCLTAALLLGAAAHAGLYQWRDADGVLHFSATPPAPTAHAGEVHTPLLPLVEVPETRDGQVYCGRHSAPQWRGDLESRLVSMTRYALQLRDGLVFTGEDRESGRCLLKWTEQALGPFRRDLDTYAREYLAVRKARQTTAQLRHHCPDQAGGWLVGDDAREWADCHLPKERALHQHDKRLERLLPIYQYWRTLQPVAAAP